MPVTSATSRVNEDGQEKEAFTVTFTNGAKQQIEELQSFFGMSEPVDVVKLGISVLQKTKENKERDEQEHAKTP